MSLTVKHLNGDACFLLTFEPSSEDCQFRQIGKSAPSRKFTILLDPWLVGDSEIYHSKFSLAKHSEEPAITSLAEIDPPDLVIISQPKSDHCNEATLRTLPASGTKTTILAEPAAAKVIRSWNYFDESKVSSFKPYVAPRHRPSHGGRRIYTKNPTLRRILLPALAPGGHHGQVTIAFVPQKFDLTGLHNAIAITYRPPTASPNMPTASPRVPFPPKMPPTPPDSPTVSATADMFAPLATTLSPLNTTTSPTSLLSPSASPISTHASRFAHFNASSASIATTASTGSCSTSQPDTLSVIFSPHGISLSSLNTYITHQLTPFVQKTLYDLARNPEAAKKYAAQPAPPPNPLTLLLHCFDNVSNPWYMGGTICTGFRTGVDIAKALNAKTWISAHDEDKDTTGVATKLIRVRKWDRERSGVWEKGMEKEKELSTDVRMLGNGEEVRLT